MDLNKLKVPELRKELQSRGLDSKGNKPVLIERLREAIEKENGNARLFPSLNHNQTDRNRANGIFVISLLYCILMVTIISSLSSYLVYPPLLAKSC